MTTTAKTTEQAKTERKLTKREQAEAARKKQDELFAARIAHLNKLGV